MLNVQVISMLNVLVRCHDIYKMVLRKRFVQKAERVKKFYNVHVEVETGMPKENVVLGTVLYSVPS